MKILIVSGAFYPENTPRSFRATELVKEFCRQGHQVTVGVRYIPVKHEAIRREFGFEIIDLGKAHFHHLRCKEGSWWSKIAGKLNRLAELLFEFPDVEYAYQVKNQLAGIDGFDLLISIAVPHPIHWGVAWARSKTHRIAKIWVADCGDPYYGNKLDSFRKPFYFKYIERFFCRKADYITMPRIEMKGNFLPEFDNKYIELAQGFKIQDSEKYLQPYKPNPIPTFAFSGQFIPKTRDPRPFLEYLVNSEYEFKLHLFNRQPQFTNPFMKRARGRIEIHDYIERPELLKFQSGMDFLVNFTFDPYFQVPSKLIDYLITGRPILNIEPVLDIEVVEEFLKGNYSRRFSALDIDRYRIEHVCERFLELYNLKGCIQR